MLSGVEFTKVNRTLFGVESSKDPSRSFGVRHVAVSSTERDEPERRQFLSSSLS